MIKVSVIIPVYKVEQYIERCVRSLMEQTMDEMEFLFVNDCTTDKSIAVLESVLDDYPHRKPQVRIINHERNKGVHMARKTGLEHALGEYIGFCDSDDWCEPEMFEIMYRKACDQNADIVVNNAFIERGCRQEMTTISISPTPQDCLKRFHQKDRMAVAFWRHLIRRASLSLAFFDRVIPADRGTDLFMMIQVYYHARSIAAVPDCLYHYRIRPYSLTGGGSTHSKEMFEKQLKNIAMISNLLGTGPDSPYRTMLRSIRFGNKLNYRDVFNNNREWFFFDRDSHRDIWRFSHADFWGRIKTALIFQNYHLWKWYDSKQKKA